MGLTQTSNFKKSWRWLFLTVLFLPMFISRSSLASFEAAKVDTTNTIPSDFYSVWGYDRNDRLANNPRDPQDTNGLNTHFYDIWAVGVDKRDNAQTPWGQPHGSIYHFDGTQWTNVSSTGTTLYSAYPSYYYAVGGQYSNTGYAEIWFGGSPDIFDGCSTIHYYDNVYRSNAVSAEANERVSRLIDLTGKDCATAGHNPNLSSEIYAISADQHYRTGVYAGGANAMLYGHGQYYATNTCSSTTAVNGTCSNTGVVCNNTTPCSSAGNKQDTWTQIDTTNITAQLGASANITGMATSANRRTYMVATSATTTDVNGVHHLDRTCTTASPKSALFVTGGGVPVQIGSTVTGICYYGVAVGNAKSTNGTTTRTNNYIWIATSNGVYRYDETTSTMTGPLTGTGGVFTRSVTDAERLVGPNQELLPNGTFESWNSNPATAAANVVPTINPEIWMTTDEAQYGTHNPAGTCGVNTQDISVDMGLANIYQGSFSMNINPAVYYSTVSDCTNSVNPHYDITPFAYTSIPLSNWQGRKLHITGKYKVVFTGASGATHPQGGIGIGCPSGGPSDPQDSPDCSYENRSGIRTVTQGNTGGFIPLDVTITVDDAQFVSPIIGGTANPRLADPGMVLQITCEATYGVQVWCDDIHVNPVDTPSFTGYDNFNVTAVGNNGTILSTPYGVTVGTAAGDVNAFKAEQDDATSSEQLHSVWSPDPSHYYAVGTNSVIAQKRSGNVTGGIWVGTASPTTVGNSTLGWVSANCANHRDANGVSLCQNSPDTFGLDFQNNQLTGQAWFGKQYTTSAREDSETLSLGQCVGSALLSTRTNAYDSTGACNRSTRTCVAVPTKACNRDFDCYGRCQDDQGFICTDDADCQVGATDTAPSNTTVSGTRIATLPANRLVCGANNSSIQGCTGLGWLSFDSHYTGNPPVANCVAAGNADACYLNPNAGDILTGWGRFLTLANTADPNGNSANGWVHLRGNNVCGTAGLPACPSPAAPNYAYFNCQNCTGALNCSFCQDNQFHSCIGATNCTYFCQGTTTTCSTDAQCPAGKTCGPKSVCSLDSTKICTSDKTCSDLGLGRCVQGAACQKVTSCAQYGVNYNSQKQQFTGYGWSSDYGWLDFSYLQTGNPPFLQTRLGDIFANGQIGNSQTNNSPTGLCNGTYLITAGTSITNFCSVAGSNALQTLSPSIPTGGPTNSYTNVLGRIDVAGLQRQTNGANNKYGSPVTTFQCTNGSNNGTSCNSNADCTGGGQCTLPGFIPSFSGGYLGVLGGKVYTVGNGTSVTTIDQHLRFGTGSVAGGSLGSGAGVVIVNGDLHITANLTYDPGTVSDLRQLASLVVIVKGNLLIDSTVTNLAGTYYVQNTVCTSPNGTAPCNYASPSGQFPLTVRGLMIAKDFKFNRTYAGTVESPAPSELVIFDGRFQSNPMPGMIDFANALPNTIGANP